MSGMRSQLECYPDGPVAIWEAAVEAKPGIVVVERAGHPAVAMRRARARAEAGQWTAAEEAGAYAGLLHEMG